MSTPTTPMAAPPELLIIIPSRGRPGRLTALLDAIAATATMHTLAAVGLDTDDPHLSDYLEMLFPAPGRAGRRWGDLAAVTAGPRQTMCAWTNQLWAQHGRGVSFVCSMGDDHRPATTGWDAALASAIFGMGGTGFAYGDDGLQGDNLPTAPVMSANIPATLGWVCLPALAHFYCDNVWRDLGTAMDRIAYLPEVKITHDHPAATGETPDATYTDATANGGMRADQARYGDWKTDPGIGGYGAQAALLRQLPGVVRT